MKHLGTFLSIISIVAGITACEKSPEERFDLSAIPGQYHGDVDVLAPDSSMYEEFGHVSWPKVRGIPENYIYDITYSIQEVNKNQYTLKFVPIDTLLPNEITFEITGFHEYSWNTIQADIKVTENNLYKDTVFYGNIFGTDNQFRYSESEVRPIISFNLRLKSKSLNIILDCSGFRYYD